MKQGAVVSTHYSQVNALRTIEDILGTQHINLNTAFQPPMTDVFDIRSSGAWSLLCRGSTVLRRTTLAQLPNGLGVRVRAGPGRQAEARREVLGQAHGRLRLLRCRPRPAGEFNRVLWKGLMGGKPYPAKFRHQAATKFYDD